LAASRYALFLLGLLLLLGNNAAVHAQAINLCEIAFLTFNYPNPVPANQPVTVTTTVTLYSCPVGPLRARIDLFDSHQNLISTSSNNVNSARVDVTNTFTAPQTSGQYPVYATAYMILFGSVVGSYRSSFLLSVVPPNEMTISTTAVQSSSQATTSLSIMTSTSNLASTESTSTTFAPTISNQNVSAFNVSSDMLYESVIFLAVLFIVALVVLSIRRRKKD
jgi:microcystin-dependent protein